jgi:prepilin-type N-terminal cleavage/methylation domain-containing protein
VRRAAEEERGMTLVELLMAMGLLSLVLAAAAAALASYQRTAASSDIRLENLAEAQTIMDVVSRDIRTATRPAQQPNESPFLLAAPSEVRFYANLELATGPKQVRLYVNAGTGQVIEEAIDPAGASPYTYSGTPKVRIVGRHFANDASQPLLTYLDEDGNTLGQTPWTSTSAPLTDDERLLVDSVRIDLSIRKSNNLAVDPTMVRTTVRLPNVNYSPVVTTP